MTETQIDVLLGFGGILLATFCWVVVVLVLEVVTSMRQDDEHAKKVMAAFRKKHYGEKEDV